jgi:SAM-dependent methyltransferase
MVEVIKRRKLKKGNDLDQILKSTSEYYRAFSDKYAKFYDDWLSGKGPFSDPKYKKGYDRVAKTLTELVDDGQLIFDVGCGVGTWSILMAQCGAYVVGLDQSFEALSIYRKRIKEANFGQRISGILGDGYCCPFKSGIFDGSTLNWVQAHIPPEENQRFVKGVGRSLKRNAWLMVSDSYWREQEGGKEQSQMRRTDRGDFEVYKYYHTPEELQKLLESTFGGVAHIETTHYEMLCVARKNKSSGYHKGTMASSPN